MNKKITQSLLKKVIEDYNKISEEFHQSRQNEWKEFEKFLPHIKNHQKIIDLGCGNGRLSKFLHKSRKITYLGIDNNEKLLKKARETNKKIKFTKGDLLKIPSPATSFDTAIAIASIHHIPSAPLRQKAFQEIYRILKNDGKLIFTVWNLFQPKYKKFIWQSRIRHLLSLGRYDSRDTFIPWGKSGVKRYYYAFTEKELKKILNKTGFEILKIHRGNNFLIICQKKTK